MTAPRKLELTIVERSVTDVRPESPLTDGMRRRLNLVVRVAMRTYLFPALSSVAQLGLFFAAAAALVVGMLGVR